MRTGWQAVNKLKAIHESGNAFVQLIPAETGRNRKHFIVHVNGDWIYQYKYIKPFYSLGLALDAAERKLNEIDT